MVNNTGAATRTREHPGARGGREIMVVVGESMAADVRTGGPLGRAIRDTFGATVETALR